MILRNYVVIADFVITFMYFTGRCVKICFHVIAVAYAVEVLLSLKFILI